MPISNRWHSRALRFLPPALAHLLLRAIRLHPSPTWEGIYPDCASVPVENGNYSHAIRVADFRNRAARARAEAAAGVKIDVASAWHEGLAILAASMTAGQSRLHVLDFGGATGVAFVQVYSCLRVPVQIRYDVVDLEEMCVAGADVFRDDPRIHFHTSIPSNPGRPDIVYASTVLPYIEDYKGLLRRLAAVQGRFILLNQLAAGDFASFATRQLNLSGQVLAYWFLNRDEVVGEVCSGGYRLIHEDFVGPEYDQSNYPPPYRIGRMRSMLFARIDPEEHGQE